MDAFSTDPSSSLLREINVREANLSLDELEEVFELTRVCEWIKPYSQVSLQFPDNLLPYAPSIVSRLDPSKVHVLGDTSYSPCCVDVVAAQHLGAKALVHFGEACLSSEDNSEFPVLYIYMKLSLDLNNLASRIEGQAKTVLVYDVGYSEVLSKATSLPPNVILAHPSSRSENTSRLGGRVFPSSSEFERVVYLGSNPSFLLLIALSMPEKNFLSLDPLESSELQPSFKKLSQLINKRYVGIEKARDARRIGLLVGTLSTDGYLSSLDSLRSAIIKSGKRAYTFLVGKPNPAKLANFPEIDVFVYISCPLSVYAMAAEGTSKEYYQPIISPFELEVALNEKRSWEGRLIGELSQILPGGSNFVPFQPREGPDVSLISGGLRVMGLPVALNEQEAEDGAILQSETRLSELHTGGGGGSFLASRTWRGLEQRLGESEVPAEIIEGRKGIASHYENEPS